jgi:PAS domain S-box-containing protein
MPPFSIHTRFIRWAGGANVVLGLVVLLGWALEISPLKSVLPGAVEMKANTALGLTLAGVALLLSVGPNKPHRLTWGRGLALIVGLIGLSVLVEYALNFRLGLDELLFEDKVQLFTAVPGRMSPYSALAFVATGLALVALPVARLRPMVWVLSSLVIAVGAISTLGYSWNAVELATDELLPPIAVHAAVGFTLLGAAILLAGFRLPTATDGTPQTRFSVELKAASGFIGAFLFLLIGGGVTYRTNADFVRSEQWVSHTLGVRTQLGQLYAAVLDAESTQRSYLLTGVEAYRNSYADFAANMEKNIAALAQLILDNPLQRQRLTLLDSAVTSHLRTLQEMVSAYDNKGRDAANVQTIGEADAQIAAIRELIHALDNGESELLIHRKALAVGARHNALFFLLLTLGCAAAVLGLLLHSIRREMLARAAADDQIRGINADLELRVNERTAALEANQRRFVDLFEFAPDALVMTNHEGIIIQINRQAEAMFGWGRSELINQPVEVLMPAQDRVSHIALRDRFLKSAMPRVMGAGRPDLRGLRKDGSLFPVDISLSPLEAGRTQVVVAAVRDMTERERTEEKIREINADLERRVAERTAELVLARETAEGASRAKSAFLAAMSHEIRTPMNGVIGMLEVLSQSRLQESQADALKTVRASAFALLGIIDDVLDFSKIEAGRLELEHAPVALSDLIESVCNTLLPIAADKNVEFNLFIAPDVPEQVLSDATRLRQVLYNLTGNAIKFSARLPNRQGRVSMRAYVDATTQLRLVLRIADNGIGMTPDTLNQLFSSFTQAEVSTTRRYGGTGLGLAICKRLVTLMDGDIAVHSVVDEGSTFTVTLPIEVVPGAASTAVLDLSGVDCIIVGAALNADDLKTYLESAGASVYLASSLGTAARQALGMARPVVIQNTGGISPNAAALRKTFATTPDVRHLVISREQHPHIVVAEDIVTLDGNCLRRAALLRAVAFAAGRASPEIPRSDPAHETVVTRVAPPSVSEARSLGRLILVAEDDEINQKVIVRQLGVLGYAAEVVNNGAEALQLLQAGRYGLLLTDLHMPEMDGYALAEAVRENEATLGTSPRLPIVALTANALRGEAVRAQTAGMDDYLTKPLQLHQLKAALTKWLPQTSSNDTPDLPPDMAECTPSPLPVDVSVLKALIGDDDEAAVQGFLADYRASLRRLAIQLHAAIAEDDMRQVDAIAHQLKSSSRAIGALALGDLCAELENNCRMGSGTAVSANVMRFDAALRAVETQLNMLLAQASH